MPSARKPSSLLTRIFNWQRGWSRRKCSVTILERAVAAEVSVTHGDDDPDEEPDDARLFREAVRGVKPLAARAPLPRPPRAAAARALHARRPRRRAAGKPRRRQRRPGSWPAAKSWSFHRPPVAAAVLRKLRRGEYRVQREIDLHGLTRRRGQAGPARVPRSTRSSSRCAACASSTARGCAPVTAGRCSRPRSTASCAAPARCWPMSPRGQVDGGTGAVYVLLCGGR